MAKTCFNVLIVCSGNLCRSPIAEQLLRARTKDDLIRVSSAGTIAEEGRPMPEEAAAICRRYGGDPTMHLSRRLTEAQLGAADLVLTATRDHRSSVVKLLPRMSRRTFTINEFARLVLALPEAYKWSVRDLEDSVDAARSLRGFVVPPEDPDEDDLEDPYRRSLEVYEAVAARIYEQTELIGERLGLWGECS